MDLNTYPWELLVQFSIVTIGVVLNFIVVLIIIKAKAWKHLVVKLFICITVSKLCHLLVQWVIPFFIQEYIQLDRYIYLDNGDTNLYPFIDETMCKTQAYFLISSWLSTFYFCIYVIIVIKRIFDGKKVQETEIIEKAKFTTIIVFSVCIIVPAIFLVCVSEFQNYGFTSRGVYLRHLCSLSLDKLFEDNNYSKQLPVIGMGLTDFILICVMSYAGCGMCKVEKNLQEQGLSTNYPIVKMRLFPIIMVAIWNFNILCKMLDYFEFVNPDSLWLSIIWVILNNVINLEAIFLIGLFFHVYKDLLTQSLPAGIWRDTAYLLAKLSFVQIRKIKYLSLSSIV